MQLVSGKQAQLHGANARVQLLKRCGLCAEKDGGWFTAMLYEESGEATATASLDGDVIKCVAVAPERRGEGLLAPVLTAVVGEAFRRGRQHLMLYTKPENRGLFAGYGFWPVAETARVLLMENERDGVDRFVHGLRPAEAHGVQGAAVLHADPFTLGHLSLVARACTQCDILHLFILSENRGRFSAADRLAMARACTAALPGVLVHETGPYLVSAATFPDYFLPDKEEREQCSAALDIAVFLRCFAGPLGISRRFVGSEPLCATTAAYNAQMRTAFAGSGVELVEFERFARDGAPVSAGRVRALLAQGHLCEAAALVPPQAVPWLRAAKGESR